MKERYAGILLPVTALPAPYGVGSLGDKAKAFVDFLVNRFLATDSISLRSYVAFAPSDSFDKLHVSRKLSIHLSF